MTRRERQLLEWIRENPCISQQELADKAGITRSSAAVHISNLMRKGYIAGRGYLLREAPYIAVVGGVNMDIGAVSDAPLVARDDENYGDSVSIETQRTILQQYAKEQGLHVVGEYVEM